MVANTATEERHRKPGAETASVTLEASPTLRTEVFKTTYTYLTLNTDHPNINDALESSSKVITNTVTAPQHYLDMILEPSEAPLPETNTYLSTRLLQTTLMEDGVTKIKTTSDTITQVHNSVKLFRAEFLFYFYNLTFFSITVTVNYHGICFSTSPDKRNDNSDSFRQH